VIVHRLMGGVAILLLALLLSRAILTVDPYFDSFAYHLPFAARLAGLCPKSCYQMGAYLEAVYDGFPKLFHVFQGLAWRITGRAQVVDVLNLGALVLFCLFLQRSFRIPTAWTFCALLAVPLIQIHATSTYIDLPVNLAAAAAVLSLTSLVRAPETFGWSKVIVLVACLVLAAGSKPQMLPLTGAVAVAFGLITTISLGFGRRLGPFISQRPGSWIAVACILALLAAGMSVKLVDNAIAYGNPLYPFRIAVLSLDGPIDALAVPGDSLAETWRPFPAPLRWLISVLEVGAYDYREVPWTVDQGYCETSLAWDTCWRVPGPSFHMGGYFAPYVLALLGFLGWRMASTPGRDRVALAATFAGSTLLAACLPRSHELRYYLFWVIVLVALCLISIFDHPEGRARVNAKTHALFSAIVLLALVSVLLMTQARYLAPFGRDVDSIIAKLAVREQVTAIPDGAVVCVDSGWQPFTFLFAPVFHPGRSYTVLDGYIGPCRAVVPPPPSRLRESS
jgi:hypothetical protein